MLRTQDTLEDDSKGIWRQRRFHIQNRKRRDLEARMTENTGQSQNRMVAQKMRELPEHLRNEAIEASENVIDGRKIYEHWNLKK
jgi:predicted Holliday junction resolvase-like endonuclease